MTGRLIKLALEHRLLFGATVFLGLMGGLLTIGQAGLLSGIIDNVFLGGMSLADVLPLIQLVFILVLLRAFLVWGGEVVARQMALKIKGRLRSLLLNKMMTLGPAFGRQGQSGELLNTAMEGVESLDAYFSQYLPQLFIAAVVPTAVLVVVFPREPLSGLLLLVTAPLIPLFMYLIGKAGERLTRRQWDTLSRLSAYFLDSLQGLTTLKELGRSKQHTQTIHKKSEDYRSVTMKVLRVTFLSALVLELVSTLSTAMVAVEVSLRLLYGKMAFEQAFFLLLLAPEFYLPLRMLGLRFHAGMLGASAAKSIFAVLDLPGGRDALEEPDGRIDAFNCINLVSVSFTHPGESAPALDRVSMQINAGEHVAVVGASGSGKSTFVDLLMRFIQPDLGEIRVDDRSLADFPAAAWHACVAWVPQAPHLFHASIADNLRIAKPEVTEDELFAALHRARLDDFVRALPQGLQTDVGEEAASLSAGQAQRLALARAFLKDAQLLILDEPTSSLDPQQEWLVQSGLHDLMQGRTVITLAHRLNTVFQADRIFVLDGGRLVEEGTHAQLLARGGVYSRLVGAASQGAPGIEHMRLENPPAEQEIILQAPLSPQVLHQDVTAGRLRWLLGFLKGSWLWVALSVLAGVLTMGSNVGLMGTSAFLISTAALHPALGSLQVAIVGVRFFGIARGVLRYLERLTTHNTTFRLLSRLRTRFYQALEPLAPARLLEFHGGDLLNRMVSDVDGLENFYVRSLAPPLEAVVVVAGMAAFLGAYQVEMAAAYIGFFILLALVVPALSWWWSRLPGKALVQLRASLQVLVMDCLHGMGEIIANNRSAAMHSRVLQAQSAYFKSQKRLAIIGGFINGSTLLLTNACMLAILLLAIPLVSSGVIRGELLAMLVLASLAGLEATAPLSQSALTLASSLQSAGRLFHLVDATPAVSDPKHPLPLLVSPLLPPAPDLWVQDLVFSYPGRPIPALQGITFRLGAGKRMAIVGASGAGKTTLVSLLLRYYEFLQGSILLNGEDIRKFHQEAVRACFSVASQRTNLFNESIQANLLAAREAASLEEMENCAQRACIHSFIQQSPGGYQSEIGENGLRLSGGERQRLILARAYVKGAPILLMDEPTANLDTLKEQQVIDNLLDDLAGQSLLLITHRLVGMERMDEILVLEAGRVVERGTHAELLHKGGLYRELWDIQNKVLNDGILQI